MTDDTSNSRMPVALPALGSHLKTRIITRNQERSIREAHGQPFIKCNTVADVLAVWDAVQAKGYGVMEHNQHEIVLIRAPKPGEAGEIVGEEADGTTYQRLIKDAANGRIDCKWWYFDKTEDWFAPDRKTQFAKDIERAAFAANASGASAPPASSTPRYWVGGHMFGKVFMAPKFREANAWWHGFTPDETSASAVATRRHLAEVAVGDYFAVKGYSYGRLKIHHVAQVTGVDVENQRILLSQSPLPLPQPQSFLPGEGSGALSGTLHEVTNAALIDRIFGGAAPPPPPPPPL